MPPVRADEKRPAKHSAAVLVCVCIQPCGRTLGRTGPGHGPCTRDSSANNSNRYGRGSWCERHQTQPPGRRSRKKDRTTLPAENGPRHSWRLASRLSHALLEAVDLPTDAWCLHSFRMTIRLRLVDSRPSAPMLTLSENLSAGFAKVRCEGRVGHDSFRCPLALAAARDVNNADQALSTSEQK